MCSGGEKDVLKHKKLLLTLCIKWKWFINNPAGKQKCPFSFNEKWTLRGLCMDFAIMPMAAKVTARAPPSVVHVGRSLQGPLLMTPRKSPRGPCEVHFFEFKKIEDIG
jgi:hypothetical protein